jgi:hypothetical protein
MGPCTVRDVADVVAAVYVACPAVAGSGDAKHRMPPALATAVRAYIRISEAQGVNSREWSTILRGAVADAKQAAEGATQS